MGPWAFGRRPSPTRERRPAHPLRVPELRGTMSRLLLPLAALLLGGCFARQPWVATDAPGAVPAPLAGSPSGEGPAVLHRLFLIGDAGKWPASEATVRALAESALAVPAEATTVLFLGDNLYPDGLPAEGHPDRHHAEEILAGQLELLADYEGRLLYLPGNHDWNQGRADGLDWVRRQDAWFDAHRDGNVLRPDDGCPGPAELRLADGLVLLLLDSQWWLHQDDQPDGINPDCAYTDRQAWLDGVRDALTRHADRAVVVAAHHPLHSNGEHGGRFDWTAHLFPLRIVHKALWLPLPVLGSVYPLSRRAGVSVQDIPHRHYTHLADSLDAVLATHPRVLYASGHEHNLQLLEHDGVPYVVSGSGAKTSPVRKGLEARFAWGGHGYARMDWLADGTRRLTFFAVSGEGPARPLYTEILP